MRLGLGHPHLDDFSDQTRVGAEVYHLITGRVPLQVFARTRAEVLDQRLDRVVNDGVQNVDLALYKNFLLPWENHRFMLRADFFNAFNHVQYGFPSADVVTSANFGAITGVATQYAPRTVQVSLRYQY